MSGYLADALSPTPLPKAGDSYGSVFKSHLLQPGVNRLVTIGSDIDDNDVVIIGPAADAKHAVFKIIVEGYASAEFKVNAAGDGVRLLSAGDVTASADTKFTTTVDTTNAKYMFGISTGNIVFKNTDGDNKVAYITRTH